MAFNCGTDAIEAGDNLSGGAFPFNCGSWGCEYCSARRRRRLARDIRAGEPNRFITLTCREGQFETPEIGARMLAWAWKIIVQRWRRLKPSNTCEFAVVREAQQNGWPHLHIAWRGGWIDREWLSTQTAELLNSPQTDVKLIRGVSKVAYYIAKYIGKSPHKFGDLKRYWFSKNYHLVKRSDQQSIFPKRLKFRDCGRTMYQVRRWLENEFIEFTEHPSGALIFNAVCWDGEAAPQDQRPNVHSLTSGPCTWERRGVFVLRAADCTFNAPLTKHLAEAAHARVW